MKTKTVLNKSIVLLLFLVTPYLCFASNQGGLDVLIGFAMVPIVWIASLVLAIQYVRKVPADRSTSLKISISISCGLLGILCLFLFKDTPAFDIYLLLTILAIMAPALLVLYGKLAKKR